MKYEVIKIDGLFCVYRQERLGQRIVGAYASKKEAIEAINRFKASK